MTPRVLMVVGAYYPELAGGSLQCRTLIGALRDRVSFSVFTTTGDRRLPAFSTIEEVPVYRMFVDMSRPVTKLSGAMRMLALAPRLAGGADVFHFHGFTEKMLLLLAIARLSGRRTIEKMTSVGWDDPISIRSRPLGRWLAAGIRNADRLVAVSPAIADRCEQAGVPRSKVETIPNGVDTQRFAPVDSAAQAERRARLRLPSTAHIVTFVGFWSVEKGPDVLFGAWIDARRSTGLDVALVYIGSTDPAHAEVERTLVDRVRGQIVETGLTDRVVFVERTADIASYLQASDIFAMPSSREGLSNALLEAMSCGLPCVAGAIPGVTDSVIDSGANGFIVPPRDERALAAVLARLLMDDRLKREIGERARRTILGRYAIEAVAERYFSIYEQLAGGHSV